MLKVSKIVTTSNFLYSSETSRWKINYLHIEGYQVDVNHNTTNVTIYAIQLNFYKKSYQSSSCLELFE